MPPLKTKNYIIVLHLSLYRQYWHSKVYRCIKKIWFSGKPIFYFFNSSPIILFWRNQFYQNILIQMCAPQETFRDIPCNCWCEKQLKYFDEKKKRSTILKTWVAMDLSDDYQVFTLKFPICDLTKTFGRVDTHLPAYLAGSCTPL